VPLKIFITGASSGIGAEIARQYSLLNHDNIIGLIGRNKTKLSKLHKQLDCKSLPIVADVSDFNSIETAAHLFVSEFGLPDIVIANAGVSSGTLLQNKDDIEVIEKIFKINFHGVVNTFHPFLSSFMKQKKGHLVAIASVAGIRGLPGAGAYSASKAALINYMESIRVELLKNNVKVTTISPGYIKSPMTEVNGYYMPFILDTNIAAKKIIKFISKNKRHVIFPWQMALLGRIMYILPNIVWDFLAKNAPHKKRNTL